MTKGQKPEDLPRTRVRMQILIEIDSDGGPFSGHETLANAFTIGERSALDRLRQILEGTGARIVGGPQTVAVITPRRLAQPTSLESS